MGDNEAKLFAVCSAVAFTLAVPPWLRTLFRVTSFSWSYYATLPQKVGTLGYWASDRIMVVEGSAMVKKAVDVDWGELESAKVNRLPNKVHLLWNPPSSEVCRDLFTNLEPNVVYGSTTRVTWGSGEGQTRRTVRGVVCASTSIIVRGLLL